MKSWCHLLLGRHFVHSTVTDENRGSSRGPTKPQQRGFSGSTVLYLEVNVPRGCLKPGDPAAICRVQISRGESVVRITNGLLSRITAPDWLHRWEVFTEYVPSTVPRVRSPTTRDAQLPFLGRGGTVAEEAWLMSFGRAGGFSVRGSRSQAKANQARPPGGAHPAWGSGRHSTWPGTAPAPSPPSSTLLHRVRPGRSVRSHARLHVRVRLPVLSVGGWPNSHPRAAARESGDALWGAAYRLAEGLCAGRQ